MRRALLIAALLIANAANAQDLTPQKPSTPPPTASAPFEQREAWCDDYATWFVASTPPSPSAAASPADVRQSHEFELEFTSCKLDPQRYERDTRAEAQLTPAPAQG